MYKNLTITSLLGALGIILGAFGAHALKGKLSVEALQSFETAVRYQMYHVLVLLIVNIYQGFSPKTKQVLTTLFGVGILFFSGSIYAIHLLKIPSKSIWFITPLGGVLFIIGWIVMLVKFAKTEAKK
ncbi:DUF423 domain-containing protein [Tenacibaculum sp. IB213877]|uniref:DUF423 domain-containing protein n=1 Tax=Tenacibaculum sp. IB213877 TaxID=3097351 RepID=UPI002A5A8FEE|nr:DUF423 domain-containing protein [Tenacibaculum sp. IB213877]MDY0780301.1 DUF423 domain-containing protein [Tenacibaculum sp. IB213877]